MYNVFLLSSKKIPFEQYYCLHVSGPTIAICERKSNNVFVVTHTSFDQNNFYFLHADQEAVDAFNAVMKDFGFFQKLAPYDLNKHQTQPNPSTHSQNFQSGFLQCLLFNFSCSLHPSSTSLVAVFTHLQLLWLQSSSIFNFSCCSLHPSSTSLVPVFIPLHLLLATVLPSCSFFTLNCFHVQ